MAVRQTLVEWMARPLEPRIRSLIETLLETRTFATPGELDALDARVAALEKKLDMALAAFEVTSTQVTEARNAAQQATQIATTARSTAESIEDGLTGVEDRVSALMENLASGDSD